MSFWSLVKTKVTNVEEFRRQCTKHNLVMERYQGTFQGKNIHSIVRDSMGGGCGYLVENGDAYGFMIDSDIHYNSISARLGTNGGLLTRDYATEIAKNMIMEQGGMIMEQTFMDDGSIVLRACSGM